MNDEDSPSIGVSYGGAILSLWLEIMQASEEFRNELLFHNDEDDTPEDYDSEVGRNYINKMCSLWKQVLPKVMTFKGDARGGEFKEIYDSYKSFEPFVKDPTRFFRKGDDGKVPKDAEEKIYEMEKVLRFIVEKLKITEF